jgi:hypothetical protein
VSVQNLTLALEANLQAEIGAKNAQIAILDRQEQAITTRDVEALAAATADLQAHAQRDIDRAAKRAALLADLARTLGIAGAPRVGTIATALGGRGRALATRRAELRAACALALRKGRHVAALVRGHANLVEEALGRFLAPDPSGAPLGRGSLVDAEA